MSQLEVGAVSTFELPFWKNKVSNKGAKRAKLRVLKIIDSMVVKIYGNANFSMGLAKERRRK
jgi:hypothetical protein